MVKRKDLARINGLFARRDKLTNKIKDKDTKWNQIEACQLARKTIDRELIDLGVNPNEE